MSIRVMSYVWEHSKQEQGNLLVLLALADFADDNGRAFPSIKTLGIKARLSSRQVQRVLKELQEVGEVGVEPNAGPNGVNIYVVRSASTMPKSRSQTGVPTPDKMAPPTKCQGDIHVTGGVTPMSPKPSVEPSVITPQPPTPAASVAADGNDGSATRQRTAKLPKPKGQRDKDGPVPDPRSRPVTDGYYKAFLEVFGCPYVHSGPRDGARLKSFLATASEEKFTADAIVAVAKSAMVRSKDRFATVSKNASTLSGLCDHFNSIRAELSSSRDSGEPPPKPKPIGNMSARIEAYHRSAA